jgi:hypothetical protein
VRLLRGKRRVILTTDKFTENGTPCGAYTRTGYVAIYAIGDVTVDERGLRFRFVRRLANAR